jgi:hypothetical protein
MSSPSSVNSDCMVNFGTMPDPPLCRQKLIQHHLREHGLWGFPQRITPDGKKIPLVPWKDFQHRPPTDSERNNWFQRFPNAGAGIPTGPGTGLLVVDADSADAIEWLELRGMPTTPIVRTRRGLHYYLRYPADLSVANSSGKIAPSVDIRGRGGQVVSVGTRRQDDGFIYYYDQGLALGDLPLADPPTWLLRHLSEIGLRRAPSGSATTPRPYTGRTSEWGRRAFDANLSSLVGAVPGTRNVAFWNASRRLGQLCAGGELSESEVLGALFRVADDWPDSLHSRDTIRRGFEAGQMNPRRRKLSPYFVAVDPYAPLGASDVD